MSGKPLTADEAWTSLHVRLSRNGQRTACGCLVWTRYVNPVSGYGQISIPKALHSVFGHCAATAPVVACWLAHGPRPPGRIVLHSCDNPPCFEQSHLSWGTHKENMQAAWQRGHQRWGERHGQAKLSDQEVATVLERAGAGESVYALAEEYGMDWSTVYGWLRGEGRGREHQARCAADWKEARVAGA